MKRVTFAVLALWFFAGGFDAAAQQAATDTAQPPTQTQERAVLTIGDRHWSAEHFGLLRAAGGPFDELTPEQLSRFVQNFAERYVLARQAEAVGLAGDPRIAARLALAGDRILAEEQRTWMQNSAPVDSAAMRADFEARPGRFDELRLSHILVRITEQDQALAPSQRRTAAQALARAKSIQRQLQVGANFKDLARKYSDDGPSRAQGGELPVIFGKDIKPEVLPTVAALKPQQVSAPVLGTDGYHLIRLEERTVASLEGARGFLEADLRKEWADRQLEKVRADLPVTFDAAAVQALEEARARGGFGSNAADRPAPTSSFDAQAARPASAR